MGASHWRVLTLGVVVNDYDIGDVDFFCDIVMEKNFIYTHCGLMGEGFLFF